jgi:SAM-dependent methyltransferase
MRAKVDIFDSMLTVTADLFFEREQELFFQKLQEKSLQVLDVGCGNGAYLSKLNEQFPLLTLTGLEIEEGIYQHALVKQNSTMAFYHSSYEQHDVLHAYDYVIARLVIQHIQDRQHFIQWLHEHMTAHATFLIIDIDDDQLHNNSQLPLFSALYHQSRQAVQRRSLLNIKDALRIECKHNGFNHLSTTRYTLTTDTPSVKQQIYTYMQLVTENYLNTSVPADIADELAAWFNNPHGHQEIHMFGMEFSRVDIQ